MSLRPLRTHCRHGHSLVDAKTKIDSAGYKYRECLTCSRGWHAKARAKPGQIEKVKAVIGSGASLVEALCRRKIMSADAFYAERRRDPTLDLFVRQALIGINSRTQQIRKRKTAILRVRTREQNFTQDYYRIRAMLPAAFPGRDDVVQSIFEEILAKTLRMEDVPARLAALKREHNRMFPTTFAPRSLDAPAWRDSPTPLIETISEGMWS